MSSATASRNARSANAYPEQPEDPVALLESKLECVRWGGNERFSARCPGHDDKNNSLSVARGQEGNALVKCFAGCSVEQVVGAIGLTVRDLFAKRNGTANGHAARPKPSKPKKTYATAEEATEAVGRTIPGAKLNTAHKYPGDVARMARFDVGDDKAYRPVHRTESGAWCIGAPPGLWPLYRSDELSKDGVVYVMEGEKCADRGWALGFPSVASAHGAQAPHKSDWSLLAGRSVIILPDHDSAGAGYATAVRNQLLNLNPPAQVKVVELPDLPDGGDIVDYDDLIGGDANATKAAVEEVANATSWYSPTPTPTSEESPVFDPTDPLPTAKWLLEKDYHHVDCQTLRGDGDTLYRWNGTRFEEEKGSAIRKLAYLRLDKAQRWVTVGKTQQLVRFAPNQARVNNIVDAVKSLAFTSKTAPSWMSDDGTLPDPTRIIAALNGLIELSVEGEARLFRPPTPLFYSLNAIDYPFNPDAPRPTTFLDFLHSIWPNDQQAIDTWIEWMGHCLLGDTRLQKALLLVGPKRSGKGTLARTLTSVIGAHNVCGPTLASLATNFGLWPLLGKLLAIVSDARLSGRVDQGIITERILMLTGEDGVTIDRKNLQQITARLAARLMILTNELPRLQDASGALASRFIVLTLKESFFNREDIRLGERIAKELPGILLLAIEGWRRLQQRGHFVQPDSSAEAIEELDELTSPISAFIRDNLNIESAESEPIADVFESWQLWCREHGDASAGTVQVFSRDLRAAIPGLSNHRSNDGGIRTREYRGIGLTLAAKEEVRVARAARQDRGHHAA